MLRVVALSTAIALVPFTLLFALSSFLSSSPSVAQMTSLSLRFARTAHAARLVPIQYWPECARYDARLTYLLRPGRCRFTGLEFDTEVNANSFGLRDDEESLVAPEIVVLGDSYAMGHGVEDRQAFPQVLERLLGRKVLNGGISSFGTARALKLLRLLDTSAARVIVIQYSSNDVDENVSLLRNGELPILPEEKYHEIVEREQAWGDYRNWLLPGLAVVKQLGDKIAELALPSQDRNHIALEAEAFRNAVAGASDLLRGRHVVVLELNTFEKTDSRFIDAAEARLADLGLTLTFLDVSSVLTRQDYFVFDGHIRPSGHEKVATVLSRAIKAKLEAAEDGAVMTDPCPVDLPRCD